MESFPIRFGRYELIDHIADGGMAQLFRARISGQDQSLGNLLVVKRILPAYCTDVDFTQQFEKEIKVAMGLAHPNLVTIYDYGTEDGQPYMAMEYVHGKNLHALIKQFSNMEMFIPVDFSCYVVREICKALAYAHGLRDKVSGNFLGIIHRDISPQNVMFSYWGQIKLFDFGVAKFAIDQNATAIGTLKGKPAYMSPEQVRGEKLDGRHDIFSLGILFWEMLTSQRLFYSDQPGAAIANILEKEIEPPSKFNPKVPPELEQFVLKALQRDRDSRYQSAQNFASDLEKFLSVFSPDYTEDTASEVIKAIFGPLIDTENQILDVIMKTPPLEPERSPEKSEVETKLIDQTGEAPRSSHDSPTIALDVSGSVDGPAAGGQAPTQTIEIDPAAVAQIIASPPPPKAVPREISESSGLELKTATIRVSSATGPVGSGSMSGGIEIEPNVAFQSKERRNYGKVMVPNQSASLYAEEEPPPWLTYKRAVIFFVLVAFGVVGQQWQSRKRSAILNSPSASISGAMVMAESVEGRNVASVPEVNSADVIRSSENTNTPRCDDKSKPVCAVFKGAPTEFANTCAAEEKNAIVLYVGKCEEKLNPDVRFTEVRLAETHWRAVSKKNVRAAVYGDKLEVVLETVNFSPAFHMQLALISLDSNKDVQIKVMTTSSTMMPLNQDLEIGNYDVEVRVIDKQGNLFFSRKADRPFFLGSPKEMKTRFLEL